MLWTVIAFDEAHVYQNARKTFWAAYSLWELSEFVIAASATPVISQPQVTLTPCCSDYYN